MKTFHYKGFKFTYEFKHYNDFTWTIVKCPAKNIEVAGDGLACGKWQATRELNRILKSEPTPTPYGIF